MGKSPINLLERSKPINLLLYNPTFKDNEKKPFENIVADRR